jgi:peptide methionine sulfoxide reductase MsrA
MNLPKTIDPTKIPIRASTQEHLDIEDVQDGIVILKDGSCCLVVATTAINFGLLSEKEQEATIYAYAGLLNSLTFSIQIVLRSQRKDISGYLKLIKRAEDKEAKKEIKTQIQKYRQFIEETVARNNVLDKKFYLIIPMSALELGVKQALTSAFSKKKLPFDKSYILQKAKTNLYPKRDHVLRQLARLGLKGKQLNTQELIQLYFNIYNPEVKGQQMTGSKQYQTPIMEAAMEAAQTKNPSPQATNAPNQKPLVQGEIEIETKPIKSINQESIPKQDSIRNQINGLVKQAVNKDETTES